MSRSQILIIATALGLCCWEIGLTAPQSDTTPESVPSQPATVPQKPAPVVNRRSPLRLEGLQGAAIVPQKDLRALSSAKKGSHESNVGLAIHYDTPGEVAGPRTALPGRPASVLERLRRIQDAASYRNPGTTSRRAHSAEAAGSRADSTPDIEGSGGVRANQESAEDGPGARTAITDGPENRPTATAPRDNSTVTDSAAAGPVPTAGVESDQQLLAHPTASDPKSISPAAPAATAVTGSDVPQADTASSSGPAASFAAPGDSQPSTGSSGAETTAPAGDLPADTTTGLPSILKRSPSVGTPDAPPRPVQPAEESHPEDPTPVDSGDHPQPQDHTPERLTITGPAEAVEVSESVTSLVPEPASDATDSVDAESAPDQVLMANRSPVLGVRTTGPRTVVVGKPASYTIQLTNASEHEAQDVVVRINIPSWTEVIESQPTVGSARLEPDENGQTTLAWSLLRLPGRANETLTLELIPRSSRPFELSVTWTFTPASSTAQIQVQEPKLEISVVGEQDILYGDTKVYTITVSNPGTGPAENVVLNLLPLVPGERSAGMRQLGTLHPGERRTVEVELTARQTGRLQIRAEATADGGLSCQGEQDVLVRRAVLEVQAEGPTVKYSGTSAQYVLRVANTGDATARQISVTATLPAGARHVSSSDSATVDTAHGQVQWTIASLRPGATRVLELECLLMTPGNNRLDVRTSAEGNLNAVASVVTTVESLADLKLMVNDPKGAAAVGTDVEYEVRVINRGTKAAQNISVVAYFSEGIEPTAVRGWRGTVEEGQVLLEPIGQLGPGQEIVVVITAQAQRPGNHVFQAQVNCNDPETKLTQQEWTRFYGDGPVAQQAQK